MKLPQKNSKVIPPHKLYTRGEDIANGITHGLATALSAAGTITLVALAMRKGGSREILAFSVYGASLVLLYLASTLYHSVRRPRLKGIFQRFDHAAIYFLIAGSYTPFLLIGVQWSWASTFLGVIWGIALLGALYKTFFIQYYQRLSVLGYVLMGWLGVLAGRQMWIAAGGAFYMVGVIFAAWRKLPYSHTIWHFFVIGGSLCHFIAVWRLLPLG
jgi:hemolysin III